MANPITDKAIEQFAQMMVRKMETLSADWEKPWFNTTGSGQPQNLSGRPYSRLNELFLFFLSEELGYKTPVFFTFLQAKAEGITINRGEKSFPVLFYNFSVREIASGKKIPFEEYAKLSMIEKQDYKVTPYLKLYNVFNLDQTSFAMQFPERFEELMNKFKVPSLNDEAGMVASKPLDEMLKEQSWLCPIYVEKGDQAFFKPSSDEIHVPLKAQFNSGENFYATLLHEMTHSTGADGRLNRKFGEHFGDENYGREELVAELTAALMCRELGLSSTIREENAAYLKGWIDIIRKEPKYLFSVLSDVGKAAAMIEQGLLSPKVNLELKTEVVASNESNKKATTAEYNIQKTAHTPTILSAIKQAYVNGFPIIYNSPEYPPLFNNPEGFREFAEENGFSISDVMKTFNEHKKELEIFIQENIKEIIQGNYAGNNATQQLNSNVMQIEEQKINWDELKSKHGITRETLQQADVLDEVLQGRKSSKLVQLSYEGQDGPRSFNAKIRFQEKEGSVGLVYYPVRQAPDLDKPYFGYEFTEQDKKNLLETGNLGHTAEIERNGDKVKVLISVDSLTNDLVQADVDRLRIPNAIKGVTLTEEQKSFLLDGKPVRIKDMTSNAGNTFSSYVMVNAEKRSLEFVSLKPNIVESVNDLTVLNGVAISEENRKILSEGGAVFIEGMTSRDGREYSANIKYDPEAKRIRYEFPENTDANSHEFKIPYKIKGVTLTEEQKNKLLAGEKVLIKDMTSSQGKKFSNTVYLDKEEKKIKFSPFEDKSQKKSERKEVRENTEKKDVKKKSKGHKV
ncbi:zincin-like metallopeptidase domain-containing protein [Massilibacteroides vaginae]|uniref:zincin-like metallopeptidase domain-containing protein n=1 Tax=Massilibacteroides vaginae TaxID=1673718 RepID=UPI000A1CC204|nr:zincin-like metallopeptidase domain-containing protein [Massilibacteroides vaginae]